MSAEPRLDAAYLDYRLRWRAGEPRPGKHPARNSGSGGDFQSYRPFWQLPDASRIDVRRSIVDPYGDIMVRQTEQRSSITVVLAADVSRSMQPGAGRSSLAAIGAIAESAARSALRAGDAFALLAFDRTIRDDISLPPTRARAAIRETIAKLGRFNPTGRSAEGILNLPEMLPKQRCLVLLASDFLITQPLLETALVAMAKHDVAAIVLGIDQIARLPRIGLLRLQDAETGRQRTLLMRPALRDKFLAMEQGRRHVLDNVFQHHGRRGFHAGDPIDIAALSEHLMAG
jgi:uncharacterized protein (DUF58 family)